MLGLFTPVAAAAAAVQLAVFYFASPPWPGLPAASMGGHYLYIDRNLIEMIAAAVLVTVPTGTWAGFDVWVYPYVRRLRARSPQPAAVEAAV
jgi:thiosulfate dehydrogenase [quinone] large subunit